MALIFPGIVGHFYDVKHDLKTWTKQTRRLQELKIRLTCAPNVTIISMQNTPGARIDLSTDAVT